MGYYIYIQASEFHIDKDKKEQGLKLIKELMLTANEKGHGGHYNGVKCISKWFAWVNTDVVLKCTTFGKAMSEWGYPVEVDEKGNIIGIDFTGEKIGQEEELFRAIAPVVTSGSYIAMRGEDGNLWRWYFNGDKCVEQAGEVTYK